MLLGSLNFIVQLVNWRLDWWCAVCSQSHKFSLLLRQNIRRAGGWGDGFLEDGNNQIWDFKPNQTSLRA